MSNFSKSDFQQKILEARRYERDEVKKFFQTDWWKSFLENTKKARERIVAEQERIKQILPF